MKRFLLLLPLLITAATAPRADTALVVHQTSGGTVEFAFSDKPVVTYDTDGYLVISEGPTWVMYPLSGIQKFTFGEVTDQTTRIVAPADAKPQPTHIYNVGGVLMRTLQPSADGSTPASLEGLPAGTYIIKNGTTSYKIIKR